MKSVRVLLPLLAILSPVSATLAAIWNVMPTEAYPSKRDDVIFVDRQLGFYGTGKGKLYRTTDGGRHWALVWDHPGTFIRSLGFVDARHGYAGNLGAGLADISDANPLYETTDGGTTWHPAAIGTTAMPGVCSIDILHTRTIIAGSLQDKVLIDAAGRANGPAKLLRSEDGGRTWTLIDLSDKAGMILDVKFLDANTGFVFAASNGDPDQSSALILKTTDGARTWREVYRSTRKVEMIWKGAFADRKTGYATLLNEDPANGQQRIVKTLDGGEHWAELPLVADKAAQEFGIGFVTPAHGWVGTRHGGFETTDGGRHWAPVPIAPFANKIRVRTADGTPMVYAIGKEVQIYQ